MLTLPDAPDAVSSSASDPLSSMQDAPGHAPQALTRTTSQPILPIKKAVLPGAQPLPLTVGDKVLFGLRNSVTPFSMAGWVLSAGYSQVANSSPNYGTNGKAFAQRLGATAARNVSEGVFSNSIMAPILHEDPRYYVMGPSQPFVKRTVYALTRAIVTRTDSGQPTPNFSLIAGNVAGAALTNAYYPALNRGFGHTAQVFGLSLGGSALGFVVTEFYGDALEMFHLKRAQ
jgi:hypothetical protein